MDEATANPNAEIQNQHAQDLLSSARRSQNPSEVKDLEIAARLQELEFENLKRLAADRQTSQSQGPATDDDGDGETVVPTEAAAASNSLTGPLQHHSSSLNVSSQPNEGSRECCTCMDTKPIHDIYTAPCDDAYCYDCLVEVFSRSLYQDESVFPPRCCRQHIPLSALQGRVGLDLIDKYERKELERQTSDRTYCSNAECATFILPRDVRGSQANCFQCGQITCAGCKKASHEGECDRVDEGREETLRVAAANGWRACPRCGNMVELRMGCNHITKVPYWLRHPCDILY